MKWQDELKKNITTIDELKKYFDIPEDEAKKLDEITKVHPMSITRYYLSLIEKPSPDDPIWRMAVPSVDEFVQIGSYDTSGEQENTKLTGLQHKYSQTALLLATNRCAMYCRFCFRKRLVGLPNKEILRRLEAAADYISKHPEINNVLISGGDPLTLPNEIIRKLLEMLWNIDHLEFVRIGSRVPVTFPMRITDDSELIEIFREYSSKNGKRLYLVTHFNHPKEITPQSTEAVQKVLDAGVIISNQTVLLRGVNDDPKVLATLMRELVRIGVVPYYVFQCRPVMRVKHHFQVPLVEGIRIVEEAKKMLDGHSKRFKYAMSHRTGKIEILGIIDDEIYFKYHQAKDPSNLGKMFKFKIKPDAGWLDDLLEESEAEITCATTT